MSALRCDPKITSALSYDEMLCAAVLNGERPVRDTDVTEMQEYLQRAGLRRAARHTVHAAVDLRPELQHQNPTGGAISGHILLSGARSPFSPEIPDTALRCVVQLQFCLQTRLAGECPITCLITMLSIERNRSSPMGL